MEAIRRSSACLSGKYPAGVGIRSLAAFFIPVMGKVTEGWDSSSPLEHALELLMACISCMAGSHPCTFWWVWLGWGPRFCISYMILGDTDTAGLGITHEEPEF